MPDEWLRQKHEREFQTRLLKALEKPKRHWFFRLVNSPSFLWLATALLITLGGAYLTNYQQCDREASAIADSYSRLKTEINGRIEYIQGIFKDAKTLAEIREALSKPFPWKYAEFRDKTLFELQELRRRAARRSKQRPGSLDPGSDFRTNAAFRKFRKIFEGTIEPTINESDLPNFKTFVSEARKYERSYFGGIDYFALTADCTPRTTIAYAFAPNTTKIIRSVDFQFLSLPPSILLIPPQ